MGYIEDLREIVGHIPLILVRATVIILNKDNEVLLVKYRNGTWGVPGGLMELEESVEEAAQREIKEEIGIEVHNLSLLGVYSGKQLFTKLTNGDQYYNVVIAYITREYIGEVNPDKDEVFNAQFFNPTELPDQISPLIRANINETVNIKLL